MYTEKYKFNIRFIILSLSSCQHFENALVEYMFHLRNSVQKFIYPIDKAYYGKSNNNQLVDVKNILKLIPEEQGYMKTISEWPLKTIKIFT